VPDQGALWGIVQRIIGLGLEVTHLHLVATPARPGETSPAMAEGAPSARPAAS